MNRSVNALNEHTNILKEHLLKKGGTPVANGPPKQTEKDIDSPAGSFIEI